MENFETKIDKIILNKVYRRLRELKLIGIISALLGIAVSLGAAVNFIDKSDAFSALNSPQKLLTILGIIAAISIPHIYIHNKVKARLVIAISYQNSLLQLDLTNRKKIQIEKLSEQKLIFKYTNDFPMRYFSKATQFDDMYKKFQQTVILKLNEDLYYFKPGLFADGNTGLFLKQLEADSNDRD